MTWADIHIACAYPWTTSVASDYTNQSFIRGNKVAQMSRDVLCPVISLHVMARFTADIIVTVSLVCHPYHELLTASFWGWSEHIVSQLKCSSTWQKHKHPEMKQVEYVNSNRILKILKPTTQLTSLQGPIRTCITGMHTVNIIKLFIWQTFLNHAHACTSTLHYNIHIYFVS